MPLAYKFLGHKTGLSVLETKNLKISRLDELNDVFDCSPIISPPDDETDHDATTWTELVVGQNNKNYGLLCLSQSVESPLLWGHYSECGAGMALGFETNEFSWTNPHVVEYENSRPQVSWPADDELNDEVIDQLLRQCFSVKAESWRYEDELRYILDLNTCVPKNGMYFAPFPATALKQVVLGFRSSVTAKYIQHFLAQNYPDCTIDVFTTRPHATRYNIEIVHSAVVG